LTIDERLRLNIHNKLTELLGNEEADALIAHIMPVPWNDVASKDDLQLTTAVLRTEMADLRTELRTEMAELRTELRTDMAELRTELRMDMAELRTELCTEMAGLRTELHQIVAGQTRWLTGYITALSAVMLAVARLLF
jgi:hypothetical protein